MKIWKRCGNYRSEQNRADRKNRIRMCEGIEQIRKWKVGLFLAVGICVLTGCGAGRDSYEKVSEPEYTLVAQEDVPEELMTQIEAGKTEEMKLTYSDDGAFYIVRGYGAQPAGSSIQVLELYAAKDAIVMDTQLVGGGENAGDETTSAYPYIVVKLLCDEQNVVFE